MLRDSLATQPSKRTRKGGWVARLAKRYIAHWQLAYYYTQAGACHPPWRHLWQGVWPLSNVRGPFPYARIMAANLWCNSTGYVLVSCILNSSCSGWAMVQPENHMRACAIKDRVMREIPSRAYLAPITDVQSLSTVVLRDWRFEVRITNVQSLSTVSKEIGDSRFESPMCNLLARCPI